MSDLATQTAAHHRRASAIGEAGRAIALAVLFVAVAAYVPLAGLLFVFMLPLPVAYVALRHGASAGVSASLGAGLLAGLLTGPLNGFVALSFGGLVGLSLGLGLRYRLSFSAVLLLVTAVSAGSVVATFGVTWLLTGASVAEVQAAVEESFAAARELYVTAGMDRATVEAAESDARQFLEVVPYVAPGIAAVTGLVYAALAGALAAVVFPRLGESGAEYLSFSRFRLHWSVAYGFIVGLGLLVGSGWAGDAASALRLVGINVMMFFLALYFLQGLALARWIDRSRRLGGLGKMVLYGSAVLGQAFLMLTSWIGLLDTWFDYRKRFPLAGDGATGGSAGVAKDQEE